MAGVAFRQIRFVRRRRGLQGSVETDDEVAGDPNGVGDAIALEKGDFHATVFVLGNFQWFGAGGFRIEAEGEFLRVVEAVEIRVGGHRRIETCEALGRSPGFKRGGGGIDHEHGERRGGRVISRIR